jgi:hypothetical protein
VLLRIEELQSILEEKLDSKLVSDLLKEFVHIRNDFLTGSLGRAAPGRFIETFVQILQWLDTGSYDARPDVDKYLREIQSQSCRFPDSLRVLAARCSRFTYGLRSKRVVHKGEINPNLMDLRAIYANSAWIVGELVRLYHGVTPDDAQRIIEELTLPASPAVEDMGDHILVLEQCESTTEELLIIFRHYYPNYVSMDQLHRDASRLDNKQIAAAIGVLYRARKIDGSRERGYKLTGKGLIVAHDIIKKLSAKH